MMSKSMRQAGLIAAVVALSLCIYALPTRAQDAYWAMFTYENIECDADSFAFTQFVTINYPDASEAKMTVVVERYFGDAVGQSFNYAVDVPAQGGPYDTGTYAIDVSSFVSDVPYTFRDVITYRLGEGADGKVVAEGEIVYECSASGGAAYGEVGNVPADVSQKGTASDVDDPDPDFIVITATNATCDATGFVFSASAEHEFTQASVVTVTQMLNDEVLSSFSYGVSAGRWQGDLGKMMGRFGDPVELPYTYRYLYEYTGQELSLALTCTSEQATVKTEVKQTENE